MRSHPNEVIILHFNRDVIGDVAMVAKEIFAELEKRWDPNVASNSVKMSTERWPTLRQAIANNQRIFIFLHYGLAQYASGKNYIHMTAFSGSTHNYQSTYEEPYVGPGGCDGIIDPARRRCDTDIQFVELSAYGHSGLCVWDMVWHCSRSLERAADECYKQREKYGKTVNVILVDYPVSNYYGTESVMQRARILNEKNIQRFSGK